MAFQTIEFERNGNVGWVRLNDPENQNALSPRMVEELSEAIAAHIGDGARALVLTGNGKSFSSGGNLSALSGAPKGTIDLGESLRTCVAPLMGRFRDCPVPIISAVRGAAAGLGCSIALAADIVVASDTAYFLQAFTRVGLVPDGGATYMLARSVGRARAMEMALLGEKVPAAKALEWGLINRVLPETEFDAAVRAMAADLAQRATVALGLTRQRVWAAFDDGWAQSLEQEATAQSKASQTKDFREGLQAFFERRPPSFEGR